ncbi:hypothetical protein M409DRAFT_21785 [Zasmidium cellare ATCC 36951]|uniref:GPI anchored protein n=1 Tax=Zasmidium cellare ATCC 36951 TaxID=1080233 RepID=A0A6A6CMT9_ZASCE|nr:uncharacterized protein M409DRAFT_21785 [Zasmidium cellare ATCC 36951]KAF2168351.1 hypothetical protein M409DRAFT_21785 [Zasmidium cellare ATCC 36951]
MATLLPLLALFATSTLAQSSILSLPFYGYDTQPIVASILSSNPTATTLALACRPGTDASDCGLFPAQTLTIGPSTYNMFIGEGTAFTGTQQCATQGTTAAVCTESNAGSEANFPGVSTTTYEGTDVVVLPVTVTAGVERLGGGGSASASTGSSGSSAPASVSATATSSGEVTMLTGTASSSSSSASRSGSESSSSSSGTGSATGSAAATSSSSAAMAATKVSGGLFSFLLAAASAFGYALS